MVEPQPPLRSSAWFGGSDESALQNRAAMSSLGFTVGATSPIVGISNTVSDLNPCNSTMTAQISAAKQAVLAAGGVPVVFPTISLGEELMKPTAMLYRNLLSMEVEEMVRAHPIDSLILTGNCDKTIPGALMGAVSCNIPTVLMVGGARPKAIFRGKPIASGSDLWRAYDDHRSGVLSDADWSEFERCYSCGIGACNVMGTATTMAILAEVLGFTISGASTIPADDPSIIDAAERAGTLAVSLARAPVRPRELVTRSSLKNATTILGACGGSTNALIHLAAIGGRAGIRLSSDELADALSGIKVLADIQPIGHGFAQDFHAAGGVPTLVAAVAGRLDLTAIGISGADLASVVAEAPPVGRVIRSSSDPVSDVDGIRLLAGNLAPQGAVVKTAAADPRLFVHRGPAVVFSSYEDMRKRIDSPELDVTADSVLVLRNAGPVGGPGMPEWGMVPIPAKLQALGVTDMVRISDARMSGTSFGTVILHVAPEAAVGGPLALVQDGDFIDVDIHRGILHLDVDVEELARRAGLWSEPRSPHKRGWIQLYQQQVTQAPDGCDLQFLQAFEEGIEIFVEPTVGRS